MAVVAAGPSVAAPLPADAVPAFLDAHTGPDGYPGAVALVARHGTVVVRAASGFRDVARTAPMPPDAIFRIYSMTKTVTTIAALMLVEAGRLALDAPVADRIPAFAQLRLADGSPPRTPVTLRHLLTHTAGFATGAPGEEAATRRLDAADLHGSADLAEFCERLARVPLASEPGVRFRYDGTSIEVVARLVEVASGVPFDAFVRDRIVGPLGLRDTAFVVPAAQRRRIVDLASTDTDGRLVVVRPESGAAPGESLQHYPSGAGGLYSTADDWLRVSALLAGGGAFDGVRLLSPASVDAMMTDELPPETTLSGDLGPGERFGFGGFVLTAPTTGSRPGSRGLFGWSGAASTYFTIDRSRGLIAILLMQYLPKGEGHDLPKMNPPFQRLVYETVVP